MSKEFAPETETERREGIFRFGQRFTLRNQRFRIRRDSLCNFLIYGLINEALGDGFDLVKEGTEEVVDWNAEFQKESKKHYPQSLNCVSLEREGGESLAAFMKKKGTDNFKFWGFAIDKYDIDYEEVTGEIKSGGMTLAIANVPTPTKMTFGTVEAGMEKPANHIKLENIYEILTRPHATLKNKGIALLEAPWDALIARYMLISHSAYNIARGGAGLKKRTVKESALTDSKMTVDELLENTSKFGSSHDTVLDLVDDQGNIIVKTELEPYQGSMPMKEFHEEYLIDIMFTIGIPFATLRGLTTGEQEGALVNESAYFDALEDIQAIYNAFYMWYSGRIATFLGKPLDFDLKWRSRRDMVDLIIKKLQAFTSITGRKPTAKFVSDLLGLKIKEKDLEKKQEVPDFSKKDGDETDDDKAEGEEEDLKDDDEAEDTDA